MKFTFAMTSSGNFAALRLPPRLPPLLPPLPAPTAAPETTSPLPPPAGSAGSAGPAAAHAVAPLRLAPLAEEPPGAGAGALSPSLPAPATAAAVEAALVPATSPPGLHLRSLPVEGRWAASSSRPDGGNGVSPLTAPPPAAAVAPLLVPPPPPPVFGPPLGRGAPTPPDIVSAPVSASRGLAAAAAAAATLDIAAARSSSTDIADAAEPRGRLAGHSSKRCESSLSPDARSSSPAAAAASTAPVVGSAADGETAGAADTARDPHDGGVAAAEAAEGSTAADEQRPWGLFPGHNKPAEPPAPSASPCLSTDNLAAVVGADACCTSEEETREPF